MAYDEERLKKSRVVIETPAARREEVRTVTAHVPERRGVPGAVVAALVIGSVALVTLLFLFILNRQNSETPVATSTQTTTTASQPGSQPVVIQQQPTPQQPIIIQQPAPATTQPAPVIIEQPAPASGPAVSEAAPRSGATNDTSIQSEIDKRMAEDATLSTTAVTATVLDGKVTLIGTVDSQALKDKVERVVKAIKGVRSVDNQVIVSAG